MTKIWIVEGATGEYSDHIEWPVCAFRDEKQAQALAEELAALGRAADQAARAKDGWYGDWDDTEEGKLWKAKDPSASLDYTGVNYRAYAINLL